MTRFLEGRFHPCSINHGYDYSPHIDTRYIRDENVQDNVERLRPVYGMKINPIRTNGRA